MCGIAGIIGNSHDLAKQRISPMLNSLKQRGPDDEGIAHINREGNGTGLTLGHRRLSIIDTSSAGHQPMWDNSKKLSIIFNGEIYNYLEIKQELKNSYDFKTDSDTEVLLAAYITYGEKMLPMLDGMFAFVLYDHEKDKVLIARDPVGIKPFYYSIFREQFWFASEPRSITAGQDAGITYESTSLANFILLGISDNDHKTMIRNINQLEGGHYIYTSPGKLLEGVEAKLYWKEPSIAQMTRNEAIEKYKEVLYTSVLRQLRADVKLGSSLSGGIDSGAIVLTAAEIAKKNAASYDTITFTFPGYQNDESDMARQVAEKAGFRWHSVEPSIEKLPAQVEELIAYMAEPFGTLSMFAQFKVMEKAQELGIKVMLDGQGGDEVNLGYPRVAQMVIWQHLKKMNIPAFLREWTGFSKNASTPMWRSLAMKIYFSNADIIAKRKLNVIGKWMDKDYLSQYDKAVAHDLFESDSVEERQIKELRKYVLPRLLRYADRNSMSHSVESRVPHLSVPMLNFALSVPFEHRVYNGFTKYVERAAMQDKMPDNVLWNPVKKGFDVPQSYWVGLLKNNIQNWLNALPAPTPFNKEAIWKSVNTPEASSSDLWRVISTMALAGTQNYQF